MEKRVVATISTGNTGMALAAISHHWMREYAHSVGADFFVLSGTGLKDLWPGFSKLALESLLSVYDRMLYVDSDVLIAPGSADLFDLVPDEKIGATRIDLLTAEEAPAVGKGWIENDIRLSQSLFGDIRWSSGYFNSGVMMLSKAHREVFSLARDAARDWSSRTDRVFSDQTLFNYYSRRLGIPLHDLGYRYNHTPAFNKRGHRYQSDFWHYVRLRPHRRGERIRQMRNDSWVLSRPWLFAMLRRKPTLARVLDNL